MGSGWEAYGQVSRSTRSGTKYLAFTLRLEADVRAQCERAAIEALDHSFVQLSNYMLLREWYGDDLGVLYLM